MSAVTSVQSAKRPHERRPGGIPASSLLLRRLSKRDPSDINGLQMTRGGRLSSSSLFHRDVLHILMDYEARGQHGFEENRRIERQTSKALQFPQAFRNGFRSRVVIYQFTTCYTGGQFFWCLGGGRNCSGGHWRPTQTKQNGRGTGWNPIQFSEDDSQ